MFAVHGSKTNNYVYCITHIASSRYYIGIRSTHEDPNLDPYMGSGVIIRNMLKSMDVSEFKKEILFNFETREEASRKEHELVTQELLSDPLCINLKLGGDNTAIPNQFKSILARGFIKRPETRERMKRLWSDPEFRAKMTQKLTEFHSNAIHPFMVSNGYWFVWKDAIMIYKYWRSKGGIINPDTPPTKKGCGYKSIGKWYKGLDNLEYRFLNGEETVFRNMIRMFREGWIPTEDKIFMQMLHSSVQSGIVVIRGTSGTGKGTRVVQFLEFLIYKGLEHKDIEFEFDDKLITVGKYFPELELIFIGKYTASNKSGLASWTSMDFIHSTLKSSENANVMVKHLKNKFPKATIILEGEAMMLSNRWRPEFIIKDLGFKDVVLMTFMYDQGDRDGYDERIVGRSGKVAKDTGWSRNDSYYKELDKNFSEFCEMEYMPEVTDPSTLFLKRAANDNGICAVGYNLSYGHDADLNCIGADLISIFGFGMEREDFIDWCQQNPMLRSIGGPNPLEHRIPEKTAKLASSVVVTKTKKLWGN